MYEKEGSSLLPSRGIDRFYTAHEGGGRREEEEDALSGRAPTLF